MRRPELDPRGRLDTYKRRAEGKAQQHRLWELNGRSERSVQVCSLDLSHHCCLEEVRKRTPALCLMFFDSHSKLHFDVYRSYRFKVLCCLFAVSTLDCYAVCSQSIQYSSVLFLDRTRVKFMVAWSAQQFWLICNFLFFFYQF